MIIIILLLSSVLLWILIPRHTACLPLHNRVFCHVIHPVILNKLEKLIFSVWWKSVYWMLWLEEEDQRRSSLEYISILIFFDLAKA